MNDYEPADDPEYERWLATLAKECKCAPCCCEVPCGGLCQGGFCDRMSCRCGADGGYEELDNDGEYAD